MIVIIGGGPAGLSAAAQLNEPHCIIEQEASLGGLCRSFDLGGATFDLGGHAFFTRNQAIRAFVEASHHGPLFTQPRNAQVFWQGHWVAYPFQANLNGLPADVVADCLTGLYDARHGPRDQPSRREDEALPGSLAEWLDRFGDGLKRHFLTPYNEKVWAYPLVDIYPRWAGNRIVQPDIREIIEGAVATRRFLNFPNAEVGYARRGGFQQIYAGLIEAARPKTLRAAVVDIDLDARDIGVSDGRRIPYRRLISTMPLNDLIRLSNALPQIKHHAQTLRHNSLYLVNFAVYVRGPRSPIQRVYCCDADVPFHKLVLNYNSSDDLRSRDVIAIQAEVSHSPAKAVDIAALSDRCWAAIRKMALVPDDAEIIDQSIRNINMAYPVFTRDIDETRASILTYLEDKGVFCAGRFGEWLYINSDDAVARGIEAARKAVR